MDKKELIKKILHEAKYVLGIIASSLIFSLTVKVFVSPANLLNSGVSGVSLMIGRYLEPLINVDETIITSWFLILINIPILILGWTKLNRRFSILSLIHISCTSLFLNILPSDIAINLLGIDFSHHLLDAGIFAGAIAGASTALALVSHGSSGGTDIISAYYSITKQKTIGSLNMYINAGILILGGILFHNWKAMLYSIVYTIVNSLVLDLFYVRNKKTILNIITAKGDEIAKYIMSEYHRGCTKLDCVGTYTGKHRDYLYVIVTSYEATAICHAIQQIDPTVFVSMSTAKRIYGRFVKSKKS